MKKITRFGLMAWMLTAVFAAVNLDAQTTIRRSYYVNAATGDDGNNGRSEDKPFKTMAKAVEAAKMGAVKTITIIGPVGGFEIAGTGPDETLITGKPDAGEAEKAVINGRVLVRGNAPVKFTYVTIENRIGQGTDDRHGVYAMSKVTLGQNTVIQNCAATGVWGSDRGGKISVLLTDNAVITRCKENGIGGYVTVIMTDYSSITHNNTGIRGEDCTLSGNAKISNNRAGGIAASSSTITISENAEISNNTTNESGGGVFVGKLVMNGGRITNNAAKKYGGGVRCDSIEMTGGEISGNQAPRGGGIYCGSNASVVSGGAISGNKAEYGAGVFVANTNKASFTLSGGSITGNEAEFVGGGIYVDSGVKYTATGGSVTGNTAGDDVGHDVFTK
jgi:predicted outer membrane repeat protein